MHRLMVEILDCRDRLAPGLPQFATQPPPPLTLRDDYARADPDELYDALRAVLDETHAAYVQEYGARWRWQGPGDEADAHELLLKAHVSVIDSEPDDWETRIARGYEEAPLRAVARAYKRETGWDNPPSVPTREYVWMCVAQPRMCFPAETAGELSFDGSLVGFLIVADRDGDGQPESLAHLWVARQMRRSGHAARLLAEAEQRFPKLGTVEPPVTDDGRAFLRAASPRLSAGLTRH